MEPDDWLDCLAFLSASPGFSYIISMDHPIVVPEIWIKYKQPTRNFVISDPATAISIFLTPVWATSRKALTAN